MHYLCDWWLSLTCQPVGFTNISKNVISFITACEKGRMPCCHAVYLRFILFSKVHVRRDGFRISKLYLSFSCVWDWLWFSSGCGPKIKQKWKILYYKKDISLWSLAIHISHKHLFPPPRRFCFNWHLFIYVSLCFLARLHKNV